MGPGKLLELIESLRSPHGSTAWVPPEQLRNAADVEAAIHDAAYDALTGLGASR